MKESCGCKPYTDKGREQVALCPACAAQAKARHDAFMADMRARTTRENLEDQFI